MPFDFQTTVVDPNFAIWGVPAEYYPAGGPKVACTVITQRPEVEGFLARTPYVLTAEAQEIALMADVRRSEVALAKRNDTLVIEPGTAREQPYTVKEQPVFDTEKLVWTLALKEAPR